MEPFYETRPTNHSLARASGESSAMLVHNVNEAPKANIYVHVGV